MSRDFFVNKYFFHILVEHFFNKSNFNNMLSILIPTYNFDCTALATELQQQIKASNIELGEKGYSINHIDNPIYHDVPDTNEDFLAKTCRSIENLK